MCEAARDDLGASCWENTPFTIGYPLQEFLMGRRDDPATAAAMHAVDRYLDTLRAS